MIFAGLGAAQSSPLERAWDLAAKGQREQAIVLLRELVQKDSRNSDARLLLGSLLMEKGDRAESLAQLQEAVRLSPASPDAQNALGEAYEAFGDPKAALQPFEKAVAIRPGFAIGQLNYGSALLETGKPSPAAEHLDAALRLLGQTADSAQAHYLRAKIFSAENEPQNAAAHLKQAVAIRPDFAEAWSDLGEAKRLLLDEEGAIAAFERATSLRPEDPIAQYRLGLAYLHQNQPEKAVESLKRAYRLNPEDQSVLNSLQIALRRNHEPAEADAIKQKLTDLLRKRDEATQKALRAVKINNDGAALEKNGDIAGAMAKYKEAVGLDPEHAGIRVNYAGALIRLGEWTEGLTQLHEALRKDPGNKQVQEAMKSALQQAPPRTIPKWADDPR